VLNRREFIEGVIMPAGAAAMGVTSLRRGRAAADEAVRCLAESADSPAESARDEALWARVGQVFPVDRSVINLNNGGVSPTIQGVLDAVRHHWADANLLPAYWLWQVQAPQRESVRAGLAAEFGADKEELALTRNASESLETCQLGLDLQRGDEALTTTQDYPRMINTFRMLERRRGIVLRQLRIPTPCEDAGEIVRRFEQHITPRTRMILISHMINLTGQILPVRELCALGRARGIPVIVDGAHALAHLVFAIRDLACDYYASSLHKWLCAPHGTGLLYVRRDKIVGLWPLMAAEEKQDTDIRKFEEIGTHPAAPYLAIGDALAFHQAVGGARKLARMLYLRDYWASRLLAASDRVRLHTSLRPGCAGGIGTFEVDGLDPLKLADWLWREHCIFTVAIAHEEFRGLRITPHLYTSVTDLDRFCDRVEHAIRHGLPA